MAKILFTGFPGFLGSKLLPHALGHDPGGAGSRAVCLIQARYAELARSRREEIEAAHPELAGRIELVEGDIRLPDLGLGSSRELRDEVREVFHLAAVYDLEVPRDVGLEINVGGTRHVLDFCESCPGLDRLHYVSTCYVSGRYAGIFRESDLVKGQSFNNFYEETKYLAEVDVQERMKAGLPATIYRPASVVGDSRTGATQKYDGPYVVMQWILRQPRYGVMPIVGDPKAVRINLVPSDFVIDAIAHLSGRGDTVGKVYQLADPDPLTVEELIDLFSEKTGRSLLRLPLLRSVAKFALRHVPGVYRVMKIPAASLDYFVHPTHYTTDNVQADLAGSGIEVPRFPDYLDRLLEFYRAHPEIGAQAMI